MAVIEPARVEDVAGIEAVFYLLIKAFDRLVGEGINTGMRFHGSGGAIQGCGAVDNTDFPSYGIQFVFSRGLTDAHP